jgi:hypothetical protein
MKNMKKKLTLTEACLMDASGELGVNAKAKLAEHVQQFPKALLEYEIARGNMALLKSLPKPAMTDADAKKMANAIKAGIQKKLLGQKREEQARRRWKLIHKAVAGVSAAAAGLVIALSITYLVNENSRQQAAVARAEQTLDNYYAPSAPSQIDSAIAQALAALNSIEAASVAASTPFGPSAFEKAINEFDITQEDRQDFGPPS